MIRKSVGPHSLLTTVLFVLSLSVVAQSSETNLPAHPWFKVTKISEKVWRISDNDIDNIYLLEGRDSAMLIDTGLGVVNLRDFVTSITRLPLIVVNSHSHPDHTGSNHQFTRVRAHADELEMISFFGTKEMRANLARQAKQMEPVPPPPPLPDSILFHITDSLYSPALVPFKDGYVFDLGNRKVEVIHVPGHTKGSVCFLDRQDKLLFTGDNNNTLVWLHPQDALPLEIYLQSLQKLQSRVNEFTTLLPGHGDPIDSGFIKDQIACAEEIIAGRCVGKPYDSFVGKGLVCSYGRAQIVYDPVKIKVK